MVLPLNIDNIMCVSPIRLKDGPVPCGRCFECLIRRRTEWSTRIALESEYNPRAIFATLTYSPEYCDDKLHYKEHIVPFLRNLRRVMSVRYVGVGERGTRFGRPHYHFVFFGTSLKDVDNALLKYWPYGHWFLGELNNGGAMYVAKYHILAKISRLPFWAVDDSERELLLSNLRNCSEFIDYIDFGVESSPLQCNDDEFFIMSKRPGIGFSFLDDIAEVDKYRSCPTPRITVCDKICNMPKYIKNKLYDDDMKEKVKEIISYDAQKHIDRFCNEFGIEFDETFDSEYMRKRREIDLYKRLKYNHKKQSHGIF